MGLGYIMEVTPTRRLDDEHWNEIKGSPQHARMALNRVRVRARLNKPSTNGQQASASHSMFLAMILKWLESHTCSVYYVDDKNAGWNALDISFWNKNEMFAFKLYYDGLAVDEDRHILSEYQS